MTNVLVRQQLNLWWNSWRELIRHQTYYQQRNHASYHSRRKTPAPDSS